MDIVSVLSSVYLGVEALYCVVNLFLFLRSHPAVFPRSVPFYIPSSKFSTSLLPLVICLIKKIIKTILADGKG